MSHKNTPGLGHLSILAPSILRQVTTNSETESTLQKVYKIWMKPPSGPLKLCRASALIWKLWTTSLLFLVGRLLLFLVSVSSTPWLLLGEFLHRSCAHEFFPQALVLGNQLRMGHSECLNKSYGTGPHSMAFIVSVSKLVLGFDLENAIRVLASAGWVHRLLRTITLLAWLSPDIFSSCNSCWV